jgi:hypothetical protein
MQLTQKVDPLAQLRNFPSPKQTICLLGQVPLSPNQEIGSLHRGLDLLKQLPGNGFIILTCNGSTPPQWKMAAFGYGTKPMDGVGLRMESIPTFSVGKIPHGSICTQEKMAKVFFTIIPQNPTNSFTLRKKYQLIPFPQKQDGIPKIYDYSTESVK